MVNSTSSVLSTGANNDLLSSGSSSNSAGSGATGFADTLATCMFFGPTGDSQNGSSSGNTVQSGTTPAAATPATLLTAAAVTPSTVVQTPVPTAATPSATTAQTPATPADIADMTPDQAYWAAQPPAVQALQNMPDNERYSAAQDLANQGYTIDVPIMVWGWDPAATMVQRQNDGMTWVPSALQPDIPVAPGDSFPGLASYDPNNPPAGSIQVSTAFAIGTNGQDPWISASQLAASEALDS